ncbi:MAG: hypothetical protein IKQ70_08405, partial [Bacteroidales bacterium]|nr:hypothetical protein [Bacteroidales bacterium]
QIQYDDSFNNYLAYMGQQEYKLNEGIKIGWERGAHTQAIETARLMKQHGDDINYIAAVTHLPPSEIESL